MERTHGHVPGRPGAGLGFARRRHGAVRSDGPAPGGPCAAALADQRAEEGDTMGIVIEVDRYSEAMEADGTRRGDMARLHVLEFHDHKGRVWRVTDQPIRAIM